MFYVDNQNNLQWTENSQDIVFEACLQELRLWVGEKALDIEEGVDYQAVFDQAAFLKVELQRVCDKHAQNFASIKISEPGMGEDEIIRVSIVFKMLDGEVRTEEIKLKANG